MRGATTAAAGRAASLTARMRIADDGAAALLDVRSRVLRLREEPRTATHPMLSPMLWIDLGWQPMAVGGRFPLLHAEIVVCPLSSTDTQIEMEAEPRREPLGLREPLSAARRLADATVHRFLEDLVRRLGEDADDASSAIST